MTEIFQIILMFSLFTLFLSSPFNIIKSELFSNKKFSNLTIISFNIILNCNIFLILSLLPFSLSSYSYLLLTTHIIIFFKNYFFKDFYSYSFEKYLFGFLFFFIVFLIIAIDVGNKLNLGWDAKYFWYTKALFYFEDQTFSNLAGYTYNAWHPHLGSFIWAFFWKFSGFELEYFGRLFYVIIYLISILFVCDKIFKDKKQNYLLFIFVVLVTYNYSYFSGLQEILIFSFLIIISKYFYLFKDNVKYFLLFTLLASNLLIWIKAEGIAYSLIILSLINLSQKLALKEKMTFNIIFALLIFFKFIIYHYFDVKLNAQPYYFGYLLNLDFSLLIHKIKNIIIYLGYYSLKNMIFALAGILIITSMIKKPVYAYTKLVFYSFILNIIFIFSAYLFRDMEIIFSLKTTMDRIVFSSSGIYLFFLLNYFKEVKKKFII
jgi:hypothetical protein